MNSAEKKEDELTIIDDIIYEGKKIYIPYKKRNQMMVEADETTLAGHGGQLVTENKLESCWWPNMKNYIRNFVASCEKCQRRKIQCVHFLLQRSKNRCAVLCVQDTRAASRDSYTAHTVLNSACVRYQNARVRLPDKVTFLPYDAAFST